LVSLEARLINWFGNVGPIIQIYFIYFGYFRLFCLIEGGYLAAYIHSYRGDYDEQQQENWGSTSGWKSAFNSRRDSIGAHGCDAIALHVGRDETLNFWP